METRNIIVIGASSGGFEALKRLVAGLPTDLQASIFIVWHIAADAEGVLPQVLNRSKTMFAAHASDRETIKPNRIYVAPPDHHLLIERDQVRITKGPKENRFRPAIDPLFRSAAYVYGKKVIGVILSGALDDGASGLWMVKHRSGLAIVQDPLDAEVPSMPRNAMRGVEIDYCVPISRMADLLVRLIKEPIDVSGAIMEENKLTEIEIRIAAEESAFESGIVNIGELTPYTCPECKGVLVRLKEGSRERFRCHTGHAFSTDTLLASVTETIEHGLYNAMRGIEESIMLLNHIGGHFKVKNQTNLASLYFKKAFEAQERTKSLRKIIFLHEQLSQDRLQQIEEKEGNGKVS